MATKSWRWTCMCYPFLQLIGSLALLVHHWVVCIFYLSTFFFIDHWRPCSLSVHRWNQQSQRCNGFWNCDSQDSTSSKLKCTSTFTIIAWFYHPEVSCIIAGTLNIFVINFSNDSLAVLVYQLTVCNLLILNVAFSMIFIFHIWRKVTPYMHETVVCVPWK